MTAFSPLLGLAPMAGYTGWPMRVLCERAGANYACSEMVSAIGLMCAKPDNGTYRELLAVHPSETNIACQLFGRDPAVMAEAAHKVTELGRFSAIDLNMGCPARKVASNGEGSGLLLDIDRAHAIMDAVKGHTTLPVTVKTRLGYADGERQSLHIAQAAEAAGLSWVCVHGRTKQQQYSGQADWDAIGELRASVSIRVIANGDVTDGQTAADILRRTGCDGLMIGRAAIGNPWVFASALHALRGEDDTPPTLRMRIETAVQHADWLVEYKGEHTGVAEMRSHLGHYIAGLRGASAMRRQLNATSSLEEMKSLLWQLLARQEEES